MGRAAYNFGVQIALAEYGLVKEAGPSWEGAKLLGQRAGVHLKDFFTGGKVRAALAKLPGAAKAGTTAAGPVDRNLVEAALGHVRGVASGAAKKEKLFEAIKQLEPALQKSPYDAAKKELLKSLIPYATVGGLGALGGGGYLTAKKVYPKAFGD
ncbi:MAG: hypothetical protein AUJ79_08760 [Propionibacterium sp. CG1_02_60_36]|nr:MAG: hypothetical protein AUJ79_08760 [Propionibacterium sp. CG1_02_60_36]